MPFNKIDWNENYNIGERTIDTQHRKLFGVVNRIFALEEHPNAREEVRDILYELSHHANNHFRYEEEYMSKVGFPEINSHCSKHEKIINNIAKIVANTDCKTNCINVLKTKMRTIAKRSLIPHILEEDIKIKKFTSSLNLEHVSDEFSVIDWEK